MFLSDLARHWWAVVLRGVAAVVFGILAFIWPGLTLAVLVLLWGAYALIDGILDLIYAFRMGGSQRWAPLLEGIAGILAGVLTFVWPGITALVLLYFIAAWAIITGLFEIVQAIRLRQEIHGEWLLVLGGIASVVLGIILLVAPGAGAVALIWAIGGYAIIFGLLLIALGFRLRGFHQQRRAPLPA